MAKLVARKGKIEVVDRDGETSLALQAGDDEQLATQAWPAVQAFFKGLPAFFTTARALEQTAAKTLERAKALKPPTTAAEDVAIQTFIRTANGGKKGITEHWKITSILYQLQRHTVAARDRGVGYLEEAAGIGQKLHNTYTDNERRRAAIEQEQIRREAEAKAQADRDRELADLEAAAVKREEASSELSERERAFVDYITGPYAGDATGARAALQAGFKDAAKAAARLLNSAKITKAIAARTEALAIRAQAAAKKEQPIQVEVETVRPNISRAAGASDVTTWAGEVLDEAATLEAFRQGKHGIPGDLFQINPVKLNEYARSLHERLDLWPGVRHTKKTGTR